MRRYIKILDCLVCIYLLRRLPYKTRTLSRSPVVCRSREAISVAVASSSLLTQSVCWASSDKRNVLYSERTRASSSEAGMASERYAKAGSRVGGATTRIEERLFRSPLILILALPFLLPPGVKEVDSDAAIVLYC
jgi:hypothetical protein